MGNLLYYRGPHELWNIDGGPHNLIILILKFYLYLPKENKEKNCVKERKTTLDLPSKCLLVIEFCFDVTLCSNLGNENSNAGHFKFSRGPQVPHP